MEGLSINNVEITNEDIVVTYTPSSYVISYSYTIIKDNVRSSTVNVSSNTPTNIILNETGTYKIEITTTDYYGKINSVTSGEYNIDKEAPIINIKNKTYKIKTNGELNILDGVSASDIVDGDLTASITTNLNTLDLSKEGIKKLEYSVSDKAGNKATSTAYITVVHDNTNLIRLGQIGVVIIILGIILFLMKYIRSIKYEKRFSKYTINSSKNKSISLFDNLYNQYIDFINKMSKILSKSDFIKRRANRYTKYTVLYSSEDESNMKFMARKIIVGFIFIIVAILTKLVQSMILSPLEMIIPFIIGFYTLDIIYIYKYSRYKKKIENDLADAITLMNNAFKAGNSITQSVDLVARELDGPISKEFAKISMELSFGLDVEVAFRRFSDRIKLKEAVYLTSSLSVLNKTGGNIIKVFDSIEKTMMSRKKLQNEFKSLTSSSKMITYVLIFVPIVFIIFIGVINKDYFNPLFENPLGIALIFVSLTIYITYIIVVKRVMKVRGVK